MCDAYTSFAEVYDLFMDNVPYDSWADSIDRLLKKYLPDGTEKPMVLDLGCGTGQITRRLRDRGYDMTGIDGSDEMLEIARSKESDDSILYLCQDMREFDVFGTYQGIVSICDCMNYLTEKEDFKEVLRRVNNFLHPGGVFIFDVNTEYKFQRILSDNTFAENRSEGSFIWENEYDKEKKLNLYDLTLFIRGDDGRFDKFFEQHVEKAYSRKEIEDMIEGAGLELIEVLDTASLGEPKPDSQKITFVAKEHLKDPDRPGFYKDGTKQPQI
ncbi:MAG: class I SAM-dependent methyltransferase [Lachnospiraceae bacterium]|uniref:Methyltransferase domain-containing protein n=1 Tax=Candidatus Weimeria bifida TaxID=2599074 RepID=A0A6N7J1X8_9FIRM|nr:methyltransferase domain-containing protein [Candidatus Weimeria bifida]RRF96610.1 MAG: class I SAM-dependent methyltransferase [Lachnospiraceae bacterium]